MVQWVVRCDPDRRTAPGRPESLGGRLPGIGGGGAVRELAARAIFAAILSWAVWAGDPAIAVVIDTGDGTGNVSAPADDPGWANVGVVNSLTGVYVGSGWVLTANHVGDNAIVLQGIAYQPVPGSKVRFEKPTGSSADLIAYRIQSPPALPSLVIADLPAPALGDEVTLVGRGWNRETGLTFWDANWVEVTPPPPPAFAGFKRGIGNTLRWGRNQVTGAGISVVIGSSTTRSFKATFDGSGGIADESLAVQGDSGGAAFIKRGGQWELAGILFAQSGFVGQPSNTAVFGQESFAVELSFYHDEILAVITPPAIPAIPVAGVIGLAGAIAVLAHWALRARRSGAV